jgi:hypothetical protein
MAPLRLATFVFEPPPCPPREDRLGENVVGSSSGIDA